jgi:type III pantothenate kinase
MRLLLVDVGNTRIKWALLHGARLGSSRAQAHAGWKARDYQRRLFGGKLPEHLWVTSVAGRKIEAAVSAAAARRGVGVTYIRVPRRGGGVTVGYREPWRLGVDRFVAAVGAHQLFRGVAVLVVGVGTAMTIDLVDVAGRHRGGVIIPAPALMVNTLLQRTHGIRRRAQGGSRPPPGLFGRSTRAGIEQGTRYGAAALIDRAVAEARLLLGSKPLVVLTGGQAALVRPLLVNACVTVPDLVLRGLAALAASVQSTRRR